MTSVNLLKFLGEITEKVMAFNRNVTHVHVKPMDDGTVMAMAPASNGSVQFKFQSTGPVDLDVPACLGNIPYLHQLLKSKLIDGDARYEITTVPRGKDRKDVVETIRIYARDRLEVTYMASDPFRGSIARPAQVKVTEWPVAFVFDRASVDEINEIKRFHGAAPSTGKEDILSLSFDGTGIVVGFGDKAHVSQLRLGGDVDASTTKTFSVNLVSDDLVRVLQQHKGTDGVLAELSEYALRIDTATEICFTEVVLPSRIVKDGR